MNPDLKKIDLTRIFFLDIETVSAAPDFDSLDDDWKELWTEKTQWQRKDQYSADAFYPIKAGIFAEFAKVVCVSIGFFERADGHPRQFRIRSIYSKDERELLLELQSLLMQHTQALCAHNGKEFDFPFLARRFMMHGLELPPALRLQGKKPWEVVHLDTLELWKFGDYKNFTSLNLIAKCLGIPSPKEDIKGSEVGRVYWQEDDLERNVRYCERDTVTVAQIMLRMTGRELLDPDEVRSL